ncbi:hypothetical protein NHQ30_003376 [Ciborinia camelliae]|nr:hypothetical protein NHQ30_003376 [Ciborinia camelliae]
MTNRIYQYSPLTELDSIRLLVLQPSINITANIDCTLLSTTLTDCDNDIIGGYTALSYVWGDAREKKVIYIEDKIFEVTANVDSALRHIRDNSREQLLWIDSVCIDQSNSDEKSEQVAQMGRVYQVARHTIIYLGESTESSQLLLEKIQNSYNRSLNTRDSTAIDMLALHFNGMDSGKAKDMLLDILERPWFTRVWVLQELIFSGDPWVQCGRLRVKWEQLFRAIESTSISDFRSSRSPVSYRRFAAMNQRRETFRMNKNSSEVSTRDLLELLASRRGLGVLDPRDMLFAHRGILQGSPDINNSHSMVLVVDYSKRVRSVYADLTRYCIETSPVNRKLEILSHKEGESECLHKEKDLDLPSWAPNWTLKSFPYPHRRFRETTYGESKKLRHLSTQREPYTPENTPRTYQNGNEAFALYSWLTPFIFVCSGWRIDKMMKASPIITPPQAGWKLRYEQLSLEKDHSREDICSHAIKAIYNHWCEFIEPLYCDIDRTKPYFKHLSTHKTLVDAFADPDRREEIIEDIAFEISRWWDEPSEGLKRPKFFRSRFFSGSNFFKGGLASTLSLILWAHARIEDDGTPEAIFSQVLYNRKFAILGNGTLALVPATASQGDVVCFLAADLATPFVLRPNTERGASIGTEKAGHFQNVLGESYCEYADYRLIGECHIDTPCSEKGRLPMSSSDVIGWANHKLIECYGKELDGNLNARLDKDHSGHGLEIFPIS